MNNKIILNLCWLLVTTLLVFGIIMPIFTFTHFYFFDDTYSLAQGIFHLLDQQQYFLFVILFAFSLLLPLLKMLCILYEINSSSSNHRRLHLLSLLGKWSMLDVFVIAILAVIFKLSMISKLEIHPGLIIFALAVVLSMLLPMLVMYCQQPLKKITDTIARHNYLTLTNKQLIELNSIGSINFFCPDYICDNNDLLDVFDNQQQWYAKVKVTNIEQQHNQFVLTLTVARPPELQEQQI
ncbi:MAG: paraquat-inducible protein A [Gammaproteobacteria bacterium]|nr:paraquat-inducible protein A [Gammaproteobacteria bacterium]